MGCVYLIVVRLRTAYYPSPRVMKKLSGYREESPADGSVFVAPVMEDKWNVYLFGYRLYFIRSFDGRLVFQVKGKFSIINLDRQIIRFGVDADPRRCCRLTRSLKFGKFRKK